MYYIYTPAAKPPLILNGPDPAPDPNLLPVVFAPSGIPAAGSTSADSSPVFRVSSLLPVTRVDLPRSALPRLPAGLLSQVDRA